MGVCDVSLCVGVYVFVWGVYVFVCVGVCVVVGVCVGVYVCVGVCDVWTCSVFSSSVDETELLEHLLFLLPPSLLTC